MSVRNGASIANDTTENIADRIFNEKYPNTSFGYFLMYENITPRLLIKGELRFFTD
jgi:hypothetical protein